MDYEVHWTGIQPLVIHNIRLANPLDPYVKALKAITGKRKKTEDDHAELMRLEWEGGLYHDDDLGPYVPASYPVATLRASAALTKHKASLQRGMMVTAVDGGDRVPIEYEGPRDIKRMWADQETFLDFRAVRVGQARTFRARPRFPDWAVTFRVVLDPEVIDADVFESINERAGRLIGCAESAEGQRARFAATMSELVA
jgi:hypothetical protein